MKKITNTIYIILFLSLSYCIAQTPFVTTWKTDNLGDPCTTCITIPTNSFYTTYSYDVDWDYDGITFNAMDSGVTGDITHDYGSGNEGIYTVAIIGDNDFPAIYFANAGDKEKILSVEQWGSIVWSSMANSFRGCENLNVLAMDIPDLSNTTFMTSMFNGCDLSMANNIENWVTQNIAYMQSVFENSSFNGDIGSWDVSSVITMSRMFYNATSFNQDINSWITSNVTSMEQMFYDATSFDQDIGSWDVSSVTTMRQMFYNATSFNQNLSLWTPISVENMYAMFNNATSFNQNLGGWDITSVYTFGLYSGMELMLSNSGLDISNYDSTLNGWESQSVNINNKLGAHGLDYCNGEMARTNLISSSNWMITGDNLNCSCSHPDYTTLDALYNSTDGPNWTNTIAQDDLWLVDCDPCGLNDGTPWFGITCSGSGSVITEINLTANNVSGTLPPEIGDFSSLEKLYLGGNNITGVIPPEIGNLSSLNTLYLYSNSMSGSFPPELGNLPLVWLVTHHNNFSGCFDVNLDNLCTSLNVNSSTNANISDFNNFDYDWEDFCLTGTEHPDYATLESFYNSTNGPSWTTSTDWLTDCDPCNWYGITCNASNRVIQIDLQVNSVSGVLPSGLDALTELENLWLGVNAITGPIPPDIGNLDNLQNLYLQNNQFSGNIPTELGDLDNIIRLYVNNNQLSGSIPSQLGDLSTLQVLRTHSNTNLSGCYDPNLNPLCDNLTSHSTNANISTGTMLSDWEDFCLCGASMCPCGVTNTWIGTTGSWDDESMWSEGHVPLACEAVVIPSTGIVTMPQYTNDGSLYTSVIYTLDVQTGGYLDIPNTATLHVLTDIHSGTWNDCTMH